MTEWLVILVVSFLIQGSIDYLNSFFVEKKFQWQVLISLIFGISLALIYKLDLFAALGASSKFTVASYILTGIVVARGSNYVFDLIKFIKGVNGKEITPENGCE